MMRRAKLLCFGLVPPGLALLALAWLSTPALGQRAAPSPSACVAGLSKSVEPTQVQRGDTARVTLVVTHTCPAYHLPMDWVFLVDVSNSMTRGSAVDPNPGIPTPDKPTPPSNPGNPPPGPPEPPEPPLALGSFHAVMGLDQGPSLPTAAPGSGVSPGGRPGDDPAGCETPGGAGINPTKVPGNTTPTPPGPPGPRPPAPGLPLAFDQAPLPPGPGAGNTTPVEPAGTEDLIRAAQQFIRDFVDRPEVQRDMAANQLNLGLVAFNERGRRLVSLSNDPKRVTNRLGLLRGDGRTRIDLGLRTAERVLLENAPNRVGGEKDRVRVVVVISDGQFCQRDLRVKIDKKIDVLTLAAGRSANLRRLREISSENEFALSLRDLKELMFLYGNTASTNPLPESRPVSLKELSISEELAANMELVPGSMNPPPATVNGQKLDWVFPMPGSPITVTYDIKPLEDGTHPVSAQSKAGWKDSENRINAGDFPAVSIDVAPPFLNEVETSR